MDSLVTDVVLETGRAVVLAIIVAYLWHAGRSAGVSSHRGWQLIIVGFALVFFAAIIDITDNYTALDKYVVIGDTEYQALLEKVVGYLGGLSLLAIGFWLWMPEVAARHRAEAVLKTASEKLVARNTELEEARWKAMTDSLTGLGNHGAMQEALDSAVSQANEHGTDVSLMMLDIDSFKAINDAKGHQYGDQILKTISQILRDTLTPHQCYRQGGDEFAVLLTGVPGSEAIVLAEQARSVMQSEASSEGVTVTMSVGIASLAQSGATCQELMYRADAAMYSAKAAGKNRVAVWARPAILESAA